MDKLHEVIKRDQRGKNKFFRIVLITFCLVICIFVMNRRLSFADIGFDLAKPIGEAKCIQWQIQAQKPYSVSVCLKDTNRRLLTIRFDTEKDDGYYNNGSDIKIIVGIGDEYCDNTIKVYRSGSLADLVLQHLSGDNSATFFTFDDNTQITYIEIDGYDYNFYSLALYDDFNSSYTTWERNASNWKNHDDLKADGGAESLRSADSSLKEDIQFNGSHIHVTIKPNSASASEPIYPSVIRSDDLYNSPYYTNPLNYPSYSPQLSYPSYFPQLTYQSYFPLSNSLSYLPLSSSPSYLPQSGVMSFPAYNISQPYNYYWGSNYMQPYNIGYSYNIGYFGYGFSNSYGGKLMW